MEKTRKTDFREKWERLKRGWLEFLEKGTKLCAKGVYFSDTSKNESDVAPRHFVFGFLIPLILYFGGVLFLILTDSVLLKLLSLLPFYGWILLLLGGDVMKYVCGTVCTINVLFSVLCAIVCVVLYNCGIPTADGAMALMAGNIVPACVVFYFCYI